MVRRAEVDSLIDKGLISEVCSSGKAWPTITGRWVDLNRFVERNFHFKRLAYHTAADVEAYFRRMDKYLVAPTGRMDPGQTCTDRTRIFMNLCRYYAGYRFIQTASSALIPGADIPEVRFLQGSSAP